MKHRDTGEPLGHALLAGRALLPPHRPLGQLTGGHERHRGLAADQFREQPRRKLPLETQGRDISIQNDRFTS
jgi:hypothetical protein